MLFDTLVVERIGVRELNQNTSQVLARVSGGETVEITDRGHPIARLVPVRDDRSMLVKLVASGRAVAPTWLNDYDDVPLVSSALVEVEVPGAVRRSAPQSLVGVPAAAGRN